MKSESPFVALAEIFKEEPKAEVKIDRMATELLRRRESPKHTRFMGSLFAQAGLLNHMGKKDGQ